jgi:hypothetical protein
MKPLIHTSRHVISLLAMAACLTMAATGAQATAIYDNLAASQDGADPVQSYGPLANSFNTGVNAGLLSGVSVLLKSGSSELVGDLQLKLLASNGSAPGAELLSLGSLSSASVSTAGFASYSFAPAASFNLSANTTYWVEVLTTAPIDIEWSWSTDLTSLGVAGQASYSKELGVLPNSLAGPYQMAVSVAAVPEPASWALVLVGVALIGGAGVRRARR